MPRSILFSALCCFGLAVSLSSTAASSWTDAPSSDDQRKLLEVIRRYANEYVGKLPNFICQQVTRQFEAGKKPVHWHKGDILSSKLIYSQGREERSLELVNDKPVGREGRILRRPLVTEGEFGILLGQVFGSMTDAQFAWDRWETMRGQRVAVFSFFVDKQHSTLRLSLSDLARAIVAYHGSVCADPSSGAIWRLTDQADDIPQEVNTKSISTTVDYDFVAIGERTYLLPVQASVVLDTGTRHLRNDIEFRDYRKFETDSHITFEGSAEK